MSNEQRTVNRRSVLAGIGGVGAVSVAGCIETGSELVHWARGVNTPVGLAIRNNTDESVAVSVQIERAGENVFEGTVELDAENTIERTTGDDIRDTAFRKAGSYTVAAQRTNASYESSVYQSTVDVSWKYLADCNSTGLVISVDSIIQIGLFRTTADCW